MILLLAALLAVFVLPEEWGAAALVVGAIAEAGELWLWFRWSKRRHPSVGVETLLGKQAVVAVVCRPRGQVRVAGEIWAAVCEEGADTGDTVWVIGVDPDGLTLRVSPAGP
jgi:membrane protein implicated in regulation of membrane protease activity